MDGLISSQTYIFIYAAGFIKNVEPTDPPCLRKNLSLKPCQDQTPSVTNTVGPVLPFIFPVRYSVMDARELLSFFSCLVLKALATTFTFPCLHTMKQVSFPPKMKWWINYPNVFPATFQTPILRHHNSFKADTCILCHQYWCITVIPDHLVVVDCATRSFGFSTAG